MSTSPSSNTRKLGFGDLAPGKAFVTVRTFTAQETQRAAEASGDYNPIHLNDTVAREIGFKEACVHGACQINEVSRLIGYHHFCDGVVVTEMTLKFRRAIYHSEPVQFWIGVQETDPRTRIVRFAVQVSKISATSKGCTEATVHVRFPPQ